MFPIQLKNPTIKTQDGTPSYTNPFSALLLVLFLTFLLPAAFTNIVKAVKTSTMIAATVGTYIQSEFLQNFKGLLTYQDNLLFQIILIRQSIFPKARSVRPSCNPAARNV
jgi:hypothetical protein